MIGRKLICAWNILYTFLCMHNSKSGHTIRVQWLCKGKRKEKRRYQWRYHFLFSLPFVMLRRSTSHPPKNCLGKREREGVCQEWGQQLVRKEKEESEEEEGTDGASTHHPKWYCTVVRTRTETTTITLHCTHIVPVVPSTAVHHYED